MSLYGISAETALSMALVIHMASTGTIVILGLLSFWTEGLGWAEVRGKIARDKALGGTGHLSSKPAD